MASRSGKQEISHKSIDLPETFLLQINQEQELQTLLQLIEKESRRLLQAEGISVFLLDRKECELWFPLPVSGRLLRLDARLGIAGACVASGELINVKDVQSDSR
ncbi:MAG: hypothetical protein KC592_02385, partial [Nitrospira sp.]|nr:hypothetical protein [Nitrospira sp.]